jgi:hypothetical protein
MGRSAPHARDVIELLPAKPVRPYVRQVARSLLRSLQEDRLPADALPLDRVDEYRAFSRRSRRQGLAAVAAALEDVDVNELSSAWVQGRDGAWP